MPPSNPNRKSFSLSLNIPLSRNSSHKKPCKDQTVSQLRSPSPSRGGLASPRTPLFSASLHLKQEQPVIPVPVTDGLDPTEKMKLLKKTRKLSRILGEVPIPITIEGATDLRACGGLPEEPSSTSASTSTSTSASTSPAKTSTPPGIIRPGSLRRNATMSHTRFTQQSEVQRARSVASIRSSFTIPISPAARMARRPAPISTVAVDASPANVSVGAGRRQQPPLPPSSPVSRPSGSGDAVQEAVTVASRTGGGNSSRRDSVASVSSRRSSTSSSILVAERTPEQLQRARAAKLTRQLGENVPPEVLLRASSPTPRIRLASPSLVSLSLADAPVSMEVQGRQRSAPLGSSSAKRPQHDKVDHRRRLSLDLRALARGGDARLELDVTLAAPETAKHRVLLKKSKSMAGKMSRPQTAAAVETRRLYAGGDSDVDSDQDVDFSQPVMLEKQRALNVRRARKMAQLFGNDPPPALFQIATVAPSAAEDEDEEEPLAEELQGLPDRSRLDSRATVVALSAGVFLASEQDEARRISESSSRNNLSPLIFANPDSDSPSAPPTPLLNTIDDDDDESILLPYLKHHDSLSDLCAASPLTLPPLIRSLTSPSQQSISVASTTSLPHSPAFSQNSHAPLTTPIRTALRTASPPPSAYAFHWGGAASGLGSGTASAPTSPPFASTPLSPPSPLSPLSPAGPPSPLRSETAPPPDPSFRARRNRAAKLSRFFGVGLHDITGMLVSPISAGAGVSSTPPSLASQSSISVAESVQAKVPVPPMPPLEVLKTRSVETFPPPPSSPTSPQRPFGGGGRADGSEPETSSVSSSHRSRKRTLSAGRSENVTRSSRRSRHQMPQPQPRKQTSSSNGGSGDRNRSNSEPEATLHGRTFSTTVEVTSESKTKYFFLESKRTSKKELEMHAAIKQLRKIK